MYKRISSLSLATRSHQRFGARSRIVAMFADMRGFSNWSETQPLDHVADLVKLQFGYVMQLCDDHQQPFQKFLGDGFVLLWELASEEDLARCLASALDATFALHKGYADLAQSLPYPAPAGYGVGISIGEAIRIQLEPHLSTASEVDFVGYPLNCAARMQTLASGFGTALCASTAEALQRDPERYLRTLLPGFGRKLLTPPQDMLERAAVTKGLKPADREGFRHLSFVDGEEWVWRTPSVQQ
ncbi:MAG: adenylate/guanylate cyclase domain-containing protein [Gammaproteobacteria bacterium]